MALAYLETLDCFNLLKEDQTALRSWYEWMVGKYVSYHLCGLMEAYLKYQTSRFLWDSLNSQEDPPVRPSWLSWIDRDGWFLPPKLQRRVNLHCILREPRRRKRGLAYSLYSAKRCAVPLAADLVEKKMEEQLFSLTTERDVEPIPDQIEMALRWTVREAVECARPSIKKKLKIPTLSASLESTREQFGAFGALVPPRGIDSVISSSRILHGFARITTKRTGELRTWLPEEPQRRYGFRLVPIYVRDTSDWRQEILDPFLETIGPIPCRRSAILEPFKVRIVSMGRAAEYQRAHSWQKAFWEICRSVPSLRLVGEPIRPFHVAQVMNASLSEGLDWRPVSGDYDSATDNLDPQVSEIVLEELCRQLQIPFQDRILLMRALTGHIIEGKEQRWGQLMGSPISFPILCLANLAINRLIQETLGFPKKHLSEYLGCRINGDDVFLSLPVWGYGYWKRVVSLVGLKPSAGKNYVCSDLAVMNSDLFVLKKEGHHWEAERIPTLRLNLLRCVQEGLCERRRFLFDEDQVLSHGKTLRGRAEELIRGWDDNMKNFLMKKFIRYARPILDKLPPISWWLPVGRGGLGLPLIRYRPEAISIVHLRLAAWLSCLDPASAESVMELRWLRGLCPLFTRTVLRDVVQWKIQCGGQVEWISSEMEEQERKFLLDLLSWNLSLGPDSERVSPHSVLRSWKKWYKNVIKQSQKTRNSLHAMSSRKALREPEFFPGYPPLERC